MIHTEEVLSPLPTHTIPPALEIRDLRKTFGKFTAIDGLSLTVQQGEIFGLLGPNGSGKTTTINMVSGLSKPTSGEIKVLGYDVRRDIRQIRRILGAVPQETALYEELSAWTNLNQCPAAGTVAGPQRFARWHLFWRYETPPGPGACPAA
jgi:ABC-type multidrug transport system ATPase subunit